MNISKNADIKNSQIKSGNVRIEGGAKVDRCTDYCKKSSNKIQY